MKTVKSKYLLASDFDRTLSFSGKISDEDIRAIKRFRSDGNIFGVVTGRDYVYSYKIFSEKALFPFDFLSMASGALGSDASGNIIYSSPVRGDVPYGKSTLARELITRILDLTHTPCGISSEKSRMNFHPDMPNGGEISGVLYSSLNDLSSVTEFVHANARCTNIEEAAAIREKLFSEFSEYLTPMQNGTAIDIPKKGVDKAYGVSCVAKHFGIDKECVFTAGDNHNDVPMLRAFCSFAISSGTDAAKEAAEFVSDSIGEIIDLIYKIDMQS